MSEIVEYEIDGTKYDVSKFLEHGLRNKDRRNKND